MSFIFDANQGETPETVARRRQIAAALMGEPMRPISSIGQGIGAALGSIGDALRSKRLTDEADALEKSGRGSANSAYERFRSLLTGTPVAPGAAAAAGGGSIDPDNPVFAGFMDTVQQGGLDNPFALAAVAATGQAESGFSPANANRTWNDPSESGEPGTAGGIMSWRGPRLASLNSFAAGRGEKPGAISPQTQAAFFLSENPALVQQLQNAKSPEEAQALMNNAWRFAGYNRPGGEAARRTAIAQGLVPQFQGDQASLPPNARPTANVPTPAPSPGMPANPGNSGIDGLSLAELAQLAANPWLPKGQRAIVEQYIKQQMEAQDPQSRLQREKTQLEIDNLRNPRVTPTDDMREYDFYVQQETKAGRAPQSFNDWMIGVRKAGSTNVNIGEGDKFYENLDKKNAETFANLSEGGMNARARIAQLDQLDTLLKQSPSGAEAGVKLWLGDWGVKTDGLDFLQATRALVEKMVPEQRPPGTGPMSDADIVMFRNSLPTALNQPGGNALIIGTAKAIAEYDMQMGAIADAVADREITPAEGRKRIRELKNPLDGYRERVRELGPAAPQAGGTPEPDAEGFTAIAPGIRIREKRYP